MRNKFARLFAEIRDQIPDQSLPIAKITYSRGILTTAPVGADVRRQKFPGTRPVRPPFGGYGIHGEGANVVIDLDLSHAPSRPASTQLFHTALESLR
ncbi:MAG: hypothetical protein L0Z50_32080 [Verrucomicrobiales bacterium]|nr:hypothetical protein [Verrucomicrobiales bacterium]